MRLPGYIKPIAGAVLGFMEPKMPIERCLSRRYIGVDKAVVRKVRSILIRPLQGQGKTFRAWWY
jgi:hypothetical protein